MILVNAKTGTFSIIMRTAPGITCLVMSGKGYIAVDPAPVVTGDGL